MSARRHKGDEYLAAGLGKRPDVDIADELSVSREAVRQQRVKYGLPKFKGARGPKLSGIAGGVAVVSSPRISSEKYTKADVVNALESTKTGEEAARLLGIHRPHLNRLMTRHQITRPSVWKK